MRKTGRICGICGDIGHIEKVVSTSVCKTACEDTHCVQSPAPDQPEIWYCQSCRKKQTEMTERRKYLEKGGLTTTFENSKVKYLPFEEAASINNGTIKRCIKTTTASVARPSIQTVPPSGASTPTQTCMPKSVSAECLPSAKRTQSANPASASSSGRKEMGHKLSNLEEQLPYILAPIAWKGSLEVHNSTGNTLVDLVAHVPLRVSSKLYIAIGALPTKLQMKMVPRFKAWPKQFDIDIPNLDDVGVYLIPSERSCRLKCSHLFRQLNSNKHALKMRLNDCLDLVVHSSQVLVDNSLRIEGDFFWGFFQKRKMRSGLKKKLDTILSKTSSELGMSPEFRTPIAGDKRVDILKHNQVDKEVIPDIPDVRASDLLEKEVVVVDTIDVPPGSVRSSYGQEPGPIDDQTERSSQGKETEPTYEEVAPGCSASSHIADKESNCIQIFSTLGVGALEDTFEACKNQANPEVTCLTDARKVKIKHETEDLIPLPVGLEIPPGFSREIDTGKEKNISNKQPETQLPGFETLGHVSIKQEKEPLAPLPVGLEIPPGFSRIIEARDESRIKMTAQSQNESHCTSAALRSACVPPWTCAPPHFRVLSPFFLESNPRNGYHPSINKGTSDIPPTARQDGSRRENVKWSPVFQGERSPVPRRQRSRSSSPVPRRQRSRSRSPVPRRQRSRSGSPVRRRQRSRSGSPVRRRHRSRSGSAVRRRHRSRSGSPVRRRHRSRSGSPERRRHRSRSGSPVRRRHRSRSGSPMRSRHGSRSGSPVRSLHRRLSRSPVRSRHRSRSRSPVPSWHKSQSRNSSRWYRVPRHEWSGNHSRSPVRPCNLHDSGRYSGRHESSYRSRSRGDSSSFDYSPVCRRERHRLKSPSPPPPDVSC